MCSLFIYVIMNTSAYPDDKHVHGFVFLFSFLMNTLAHLDDTHEHVCVF